MGSIFRSKWFQQLIGISVSVAIVGWMAFSLNWHEVFQAMKSVSLWPFALSFLIVAAHFLLRAFRWRYLLPENENPPAIRTLFDSMMAGNFATYVLPLRAGEFIRPFLLSRQSTYPFPTAFVSVVIERFFDLATVLLSFAILLIYIPDMDPMIYKGAQGLGVLAIGILAVMLVGTFLPTLLRTISAKVGSFLPAKLERGIGKFTDDFLHGLSVLRHHGNLLRVIALTVGVWLSCYVLFYSFLFAFPGPHTFLEGMAVAVITALAVAAPSAPGFIGVYQLGCIIALKPFGMSEEMAAAYGIITHLFHYSVTIGYGLILLNRYNMRMRDLQAKSEEPA